MSVPVYVEDWPFQAPEEAVPYLYQLARRLGAPVHWDARTGTLHVDSALHGRVIGLDCAPGLEWSWRLLEALCQRLEAAGAHVVPACHPGCLDAWVRLGLAGEAGYTPSPTCVVLPRLSGPAARRLARHVAAALGRATGTVVRLRYAGWWPARAPGVALAGALPGGPRADGDQVQSAAQALTAALVHFFRPALPEVAPAGLPALWIWPDPSPAVTPAATPSAPMPAPAGPTGAADPQAPAGAQPGATVGPGPTGRPATAPAAPRDPPVYVWTWTFGKESVERRRC